MLYGCCVNLLPKTLDRIGLEYAGRLKRLGYDYIELPPERAGPAQRAGVPGCPDGAGGARPPPAAPATTLCPPAFRSPAPTSPPERS